MDFPSSCTSTTLSVGNVRGSFPYTFTYQEGEKITLFDFWIIEYCTPLITDIVRCEYTVRLVKSLMDFVRSCKVITFISAMVFLVEWI